MIIIARVSFKALRTIMVYISFWKIANSKILRAEQLLEDHEDWRALDPQRTAIHLSENEDWQALDS